MYRFRWLLLVLVALVMVWFGWHAYNYFLDRSEPDLQISGIVQGSYYSGDTYCVVNGRDDYRVGDISIYLDEKPLVNTARIGKREFEYSFPIATKMIPNGKHMLKVVVRDASLHKNQASKEVAFFVDNTPLQAAFVRSDADLKVFQGRTIHLQFQVNKPIKQAVAKIFSKDFACVPEAANSLIYECFIPVETEMPGNEYLLTIEVADNVGAIETLETKVQVCPFPFKKQNLSLKDEKVKHENDTGLPASQLELDLARATLQSPNQKLWQGTFYAPIEMKGISTDFGTIRTTQHRGKYQHNAIDALGTPKSVVWATQDGVVVIKERYAHSGNTIVVDHGCGILSLFFHLDSFANVNVGDKVRKGNPLGTIGMTGYASGYHLHWEMRINNVPIDPMQWIKIEF